MGPQHGALAALGYRFSRCGLLLLLVASRKPSRASGLGWHVVHHQSEDYNMAVALRQAWFTTFTSWLFYLPLAVLGVAPSVYATSVAVSLLYQFWIHTELIGKLGPIEWVFNTPSHHRVHHSVNASYIDKNYAAILIVWDGFWYVSSRDRDTGLRNSERASWLESSLGQLRALVVSGRSQTGPSLAGSFVGLVCAARMATAGAATSPHARS